MSSHIHRLNGIALAELVSYTEEFGTISAELPTFKLADLVNMYKFCLQRLGCDTTSLVNTSRLKERLVFQIPGLQCYNKGHDVYLAFRDDVGFALHKALHKALHNAQHKGTSFDSMPYNAKSTGLGLDLRWWFVETLLDNTTRCDGFLPRTCSLRLQEGLSTAVFLGEGVFMLHCSL